MFTKCDLLWDTNAFPFLGRNRLQSVYIRLNGSSKRLNGLLIRLKNLHQFNALSKTFKRFAYLSKKIASV